MSKHNALLARLFAKERVMTEDGGLSIVCPLDYAENSTYQRFSGFDVLTPAASDVLSSAEFVWRQAAVWILASGEELRVNSGRSRIINLVESRITNARRTMRNQVSNDLYSDGTLAKQMGGLQALIADAGGGTVGGIDSAVFTFWRNKVQSAAAPLQGGGAITPSSTTIESLMLPLYIELERGGDYSDLIIMSNDYYTFFEQSQTSIKRYAYTDNDLAEAGFISLRYHRADVVHDGGSGIPGAHGYFINTDYMKFVGHENAMMTLSEEIRPSNQDAVGYLLLLMGNLTVGNRSLQGIMKS
ncbi:MAG: phage major capsid protein [bacterium]